MATTLLPFREYDEHDVINLFAYDGALDRGHVVKILSGWKNTDETQLMGNVGGSFTNTVSQRYCFMTLKKLTRTAKSLYSILAKLRRWKSLLADKRFLF
jgi:hypothetical protein